MNTFKKTVNLKDNSQDISKPLTTAREKPAVQSRSSQIENVYNKFNEPTEETKMHTINKPKLSKFNVPAIKIILFLVVLILIIFFIYSKTRNNNPQTTANQEEMQTRWYAVRLINNEVYYGQITDTTSDPIIISDVYYNYDQGANKQAPDSGNLRLVKRGKETHGPDGTMSIIRSQVLLMEVITEDSKVLQAIRGYEKQ